MRNSNSLSNQTQPENSFLIRWWKPLAYVKFGFLVYSIQMSRKECILRGSSTVLVYRWNVLTLARQNISLLYYKSNTLLQGFTTWLKLNKKVTSQDMKKDPASDKSIYNFKFRKSSISNLIHFKLYTKV